MRVSSHCWLIVVPALCGCVAARGAAKPQAAAVTELRQHVGPTVNVDPGRIYVIDAAGARLVVDIWADSGADQGTALFRQETERRDLEQLLAVVTIRAAPPRCRSSLRRLFLTSAQCPADRIVNIVFHVDEIQRTSLGDPFELLEVFNRPVSGLIYNQRAETRIMQWRSALAESISRKGRASVAMAITSDRVRQGEVLVRGARTALEARNLVRWVDGVAPGDWWTQNPEEGDAWGTGREFRFSIPKGTFLRAELREISLVDESTFPRVDFRLGAERHLEALPNVLVRDVVDYGATQPKL